MQYTTTWEIEKHPPLTVRCHACGIEYDIYKHRICHACGQQNQISILPRTVIAARQLETGGFNLILSCGHIQFSPKIQRITDCNKCLTGIPPKGIVIRLKGVQM